jgi:hypothetical protein
VGEAALSYGTSVRWRSLEWAVIGLDGAKVYLLPVSDDIFAQLGPVMDVVEGRM